jgi:hypothetical protein
VQRDHARQPDHAILLGPDGEPWLPKDPFHTYDYEGPTVFGLDTEWQLTQLALQHTTNAADTR